MMKKYLLPIAAMAMTAAMTACSDDDGRIWVVDDPDIAISENEAGFSSLTFEWEKVDGVNQYGYELADPDGSIVARGVTDDNIMTFESLLPSTTYTLTVYVYGPDGTPTRRIVLSATTKAIVKLAAPVVTADVKGARVNITWDAVDNAGHYHYSYLVNGDEVAGDTDVCSLELRALPAGDYTFTVTAVTDAEGYASSDASSCDFSRVRNAVWSVDGTYISALFPAGINRWDATLTCYDDGSYVISDWYGVAGYDMEFTVNDDLSVDIESNRTDAWGYYLVASGTEQVPDVNIWPYTDGDSYNSAYDADEDYGMVWYYVTDGGSNYGYDTFEWGNNEPVPPTLDLSGTYNVDNWSGYESYWFSSSGDWETFSYSNFDVTITQTDNTVILTGFMNGGEALTGTIDADTRTITFPAQDLRFGSYNYRFARERDDLWDHVDQSVVNDAVVATFDENFNIDLSGWGLYYINDDGSVYVYFTGVKETLSKK